MDFSLKDWKLIKKSLVFQVNIVYQEIELIKEKPGQSKKLEELLEEKKRLFELIEIIRKHIEF